MQHGFLDDVPVNKVQDFQDALEEFMETRKQDVLQLIADDKAITDRVKSALESALEDFKSSWK